MQSGMEPAGCLEGAEPGSRGPSPFSWLGPQGRPQTERQQKPKALGTGQYPEESTCPPGRLVVPSPRLPARVEPWLC